MAREKLKMEIGGRSASGHGGSIKEDFIRNLEKTRIRLGLSKSETRVIDWGCGTGQTVARLRAMGYSAWGVDVAQRSLEKGMEAHASESYFTQDMLTKIEADGSTRFPDGHFHFVMSNMVIEHVPEISTMVGEIARVTAPGGAGLHLFPAQWHFFESHCQLPMVHWFPKNTSRTYIAMLSLALV
jgi:2-polyprenyl-3-methyl-5-hydroxy-6-metoxy-1,4-benzoquinol methylase